MNHCAWGEAKQRNEQPDDNSNFPTTRPSKLQSQSFMVRTEDGVIFMGKPIGFHAKYPMSSKGFVDLVGIRKLACH